MRSSPRCGAKTRAGTPCEAPAVKGKKRCRMHGGAKGSGAPKGNQNALKSGLYTAESLRLRRHVNQLIRDTKKIFEEM
ncbi:HGGxSTG domain-containing protein [Novosphingobium album (ex Liu et al. 2023)]|uniref:HGGxSTG domain-containing protein n=1 Tax=Novosphingobium album (ex Liu et al. 2023) TaxID=3031130 RepID=UPI003D166555